MGINRLVMLGIIAGIAALAAGRGTTRADEPTTAAAPAEPAPGKRESPPPVAALKAGDVWGDDYTKAWYQAKKLNRPVLLHFYSNGCPPCRQMERDVLNSNKVLRELHSCCVPVKVNRDVDPVFALRMGVTSLPCDVLVTMDRKIQTINLGYLSVDQYTSLVAGVRTDKTTETIEVSNK